MEYEQAHRSSRAPAPKDRAPQTPVVEQSNAQIAAQIPVATEPPSMLASFSQERGDPETGGSAQITALDSNVTVSKGGITVEGNNNARFSFGHEGGEATQDVYDDEGQLQGSSYVQNRAAQIGGGLGIGTVGAGILASNAEDIEVFAALGEDGQVKDEQALIAQAELFVDRDPGTDPNRVLNLMNGFAALNIADSVRSTIMDKLSVDVGVSGPAGLGVGVSASDQKVVEREVLVLPNGNIRVTVSESDRGAVGVNATALGVLNAAAEAGATDSTGYTMEFDRSTEQGCVDLAINQLTGLFPGAAEALGIHNVADAQRFIDAGGVDAIGTEDWKAPEGFSYESAVELNAALYARRGEQDGDASITTVEEGQGTDLTTSGTLLGFNLASRASVENQYASVDTTTGERALGGDSRVGTDGFWVENAMASTQYAITEQGFAVQGMDSFDATAEGATGELADSIRQNPQIATLVDDPTRITQIQGDTDAMFAVLKEMPPGAMPNVEGLMHYLQEMAKRIQPIDGMPGPARTDRGMTADQINAALPELATLASGEIEVAQLSAETLTVYATMQVHRRGFDVLSDVAQHPDPAVRQQVFADLMHTMGPEGATRFSDWLQEHPEMEGIVEVKSRLVAGSQSANALARGERTEGEQGFVDEIEAADLDAATLDGVLGDLHQIVPGGIGGLVVHMGAGDRARFLRLGRDSPALRAVVVEMIDTAPQRLLPAGLSPEERTQWAQENLQEQYALSDEQIAAITSKANQSFASVDLTELGTDIRDELQQPESDAQAIVQNLQLQATQGPAAVETVLDALTNQPYLPGANSSPWTMPGVADQERQLTNIADPLARLVERADSVGELAAFQRSLVGTRYEQQVQEYLANRD